MKEVFKGILIFLLIVVISIGLWFGGVAVKAMLFPAQKVSNAVDVAYDVNKKVMDSDNAIKSYKYFLDQEEAIQAKYKQEDTAKKAIETYKSNLPADKEKWTQSDKNELSRLQTVADAISNQTDAMIADYNAKSKDVTMNIWKDNLPSTMSRAFLANAQYSK